MAMMTITGEEAGTGGITIIEGIGTITTKETGTGAAAGRPGQYH
jgi:hypothetical protein